MIPGASRSLAAAGLALALLACNNDKETPAAAASAAAAVASASAAPAARPVPPSASQVSGKVAETMDAAGYTYIRMTTANGDKWAAVTQAKVNVGDNVTILNAMVMPNFKSPTLNRTFDEILFGTLAGTPPPMAPPAAAGSAAPVSSAPVPRATGPGAHTVAEVFGTKAALKDKPVTLRGRVTKFNANILGHNWIHIVDGTGGAATKDNDLTVTTSATAAVGDVILVKGTVHLDKDFGAGYAYPVIVEDATIEK